MRRRSAESIPYRTGHHERAGRRDSSAQERSEWVQGHGMGRPHPTQSRPMPEMRRL